jgi:hypothetical protein
MNREKHGAFRLLSLNAACTFIIANLMRSAAVPWIGYSQRSLRKNRTFLCGLSMSGRRRIRFRGVLVFRVSWHLRLLGRWILLRRCILQSTCQIGFCHLLLIPSSRRDHTGHSVNDAEIDYLGLPSELWVIKDEGSWNTSVASGVGYLRYP